MNAFTLLPFDPPMVTVTVQVCPTALTPTLPVICVPESSTTFVAAMPHTVTDGDPEKFVPMIVMMHPPSREQLVGVMLLTVGSPAA